MSALEGLSGSVPVTFWLWGLGFVFGAGAIGFLAGACLTWFNSGSRLKKALAKQENLMPIVREQLQSALEAARALKERRQLLLTNEETTELSTQRDSLAAMLTEVVELQQQVAATLQGKAKPRSIGEAIPFEMPWVREPCDELTKLPTADAMMNNLSALMAKVTENRSPSGFLFIKLDSYDKLADRHGTEGRDALLKKFSSVIIRATREQDLVCRYDFDTIAVLFPSLEEQQGVQLAHAVRKSILNYHFRLSESGQAVILNAHLGYTDCLPHENEDLILNRAGNALAKSQSRGFNQLHCHNGESLALLTQAN